MPVLPASHHLLRHRMVFGGIVEKEVEKGVGEFAIPPSSVRCIFTEQEGGS